MNTDQGSNEDCNVWSLNQKLDQPMDEEARRIRNMYQEKVRRNLFALRFFLSHLKSILSAMNSIKLYLGNPTKF